MKVESLLGRRAIEAQPRKPAKAAEVQALEQRVAELTQQVSDERARREAAEMQVVTLTASLEAARAAGGQVVVPPAEVRIERAQPVGYEVRITKTDADGLPVAMSITPQL